MARKRYLITYDVADDKRRTGVFKLLSGQGDHVQFSVFICELNPRELAHVHGRLTEMLHHRQDQVLILDMGHADNSVQDTLQCIGKAYNPRIRVLVV